MGINEHTKRDRPVRNATTCANCLATTRTLDSLLPMRTMPGKSWLGVAGTGLKNNGGFLPAMKMRQSVGLQSTALSNAEITRRVQAMVLAASQRNAPVGPALLASIQKVVGGPPKLPPYIPVVAKETMQVSAQQPSPAGKRKRKRYHYEEKIPRPTLIVPPLLNQGIFAYPCMPLRRVKRARVAKEV